MNTPTTHIHDNANEAQFLAPETHQQAGGQSDGWGGGPEVAEFDVVDDSVFFAPVASDLVDGLLGQYQSARRRIEEVADLLRPEGELFGVMGHFVAGNASDERTHRTSLAVGTLFAVEGAVASLNSTFWGKALALTDVLETMPQKRRDEWNTSIRENKAPDFTETTVRDTIAGMLGMRQQFLAERVDGIFRGLSGEHVTNAPEAFGKRMILARVMCCYGFANSPKTGLIHDLRCVIAKFMGRDAPRLTVTNGLVDALKECFGEWVSLDGGALRIKLFKNGNAHMEVHPDMAWRLNSVLAHMHPLAIPAQFRARPKQRTKEFQTINRTLSFAVLELLSQQQHHKDAQAFVFGYDAKKAGETYAEAVRVLVSIGGVPDAHGMRFKFDYAPWPVITTIRLSGCLPDQKSHQFYPTPPALAENAVDRADIGDADTVLEPSAGHGDLAAFLPAEQTRCVEVSELRCAVLKARGFDTVQADFLEWADTTSERFTRVVMNPPFSESRWRLHTLAAGRLVLPGGRLVAILPGSARNAFQLPGFDCTWSAPILDAFDGTGVCVAILTATRRSGAAV